MVKLIKANLRKDRTILIIFLLIITLSAMLMHTGLLASDYEKLYDEYAQETDLCDYYVFTADDSGKANSWFEQADHIERYHFSDVVLLSSFTFSTSKNSKEIDSNDWIVQSIADDNGFSDLKFIERDDSVSGDKIYLNLYLAYSNNICAGDKIYLDSNLGKHEYTVAGIYQHLFMGNIYNYMSVMVEPESFNELKSARDKYINDTDDLTWRRLYTVNVKEGYEPQKCLKECKSVLQQELSVFCNGYTISYIENNYTATVNILAAFMGAFSVIIMIICLIIIVFTINNNISRDIINIGALKAVGHTVGQIRAALTAEYLILGVTGSAAGIVLSYLIYPAFEYLFIREISSLAWRKAFYPGISFGVLSGVIAVTVITAFMSTIKIKELHPATALRFGLQSNSFKKNHLPLSETNGSLDVLLAIKSTLQNKMQNVITGCMIFSVSFVMMFSCVLYYNTRTDITNFQRLVQGDVADGYFYIKDKTSEGAAEVIDKLQDVDGISDSYAINKIYAYIGDKETDLVYLTAPQRLSCTVYAGVLPKEENEALVGSTLADELDLDIGDEIDVSYGGKKERLLITGLQQSALNNRLYVHENTAKKLGVNVVYENIRIRVTDADDDKVDEILKKGASLSENIISTENNFRFQHSCDNTPVYAIGLVVMILVVLSAATVILIIRLLVKTMFVKQEKEFGIKKAVGFTSSQLRFQLSLSLMPTTLISAAAGAVSGYFLVNPLFTLVLGGYGLKRSDLIVCPSLIAIPTFVISVLVFVFSYIMSGRMKKMSAYKLILE